MNYIYDLAGQQITEINSGGGWNRGEVYAGGRHVATYANSTTYFIHPDWLGTERARSNVSGGLCETTTSLPFGDWQSNSGSCADASPMHFTGKERDSESGLDNFGARYDASSMGRFMSPDPDNAGARLGAPQSWNAYSYVLNNPLKYIDPFGLDCIYLNEAGTAVDHILTGFNQDCGLNADGTEDNGYYVDGTVNRSSIAFTGGDNNTMFYSFTSEDSLSPLIGHNCVGDCSTPDATVRVFSSFDQPEWRRWEPDPSYLELYTPPVRSSFDLWHMTPQQQSDVRACIATGGEYGGESLEPPDAGQAIAQVHDPNGKPAQYPGNNKPIIPNTKGAKMTPSVTGPVGFLEFLTGGQRCVQNLATQ